MSELTDHAKRELNIVGLKDDSPMFRAILEHVELFDKQQHTEGSGAYLAAAVAKLFKLEILSPLTGEDDEWTLINGLLGEEEKCWQNKRRPYVFKDNDGNCWDIEGKIFFYEKEGKTVYYCNKDSHTKVEFPYTPNLVLSYRNPEDDE